MIRRMITVSIRKLTQKDYDGISTGIRQIPLIHFATPPEESGGRDAQVNPPVVTIQSTPPNSSSLARNTLDLSRHSSRLGTSRSHPLVDLTQPERSSRPSTRHPPPLARSFRGSQHPQEEMQPQDHQVGAQVLQEAEPPQEKILKVQEVS